MGFEEKALHNVRQKIAEVVKKEGNRIVVGYRGEAKTYTEGETWEEDGKQWEFKNGIKQSVSKTQDARTPMFCPNCQKVMGHWLDTKFWRLRGVCQDCVLKDEAKMRISGDWSQYELLGELRNQVAHLTERIAEITSYRDALTQPEIIHADDEKILMVEKWTVDLNKIRTDMTTDINELTELLKITTAQLNEVEQHGTS